MVQWLGVAAGEWLDAGAFGRQFCVSIGQRRDDRVHAPRPQLHADLLATAVERACREADPRFRRVNIDILGNADAFVHAHIWPRYEWESPELVQRPVWLYDPASWGDPSTALSDRHNALRTSITTHLISLRDADSIRITD